MSSGAKVVAAFIRETTPGITPTAGAWNLLRRSSFGLKPTQNTNDNDEIAGDRMAQGVSRGTVDVGGDVGTRFRWNQHDDFLASCFGAEWVDNVLTMGNGRITFSVASYAEDVGIAQIARGCQVATLQIEIPNDGDITATVTFAGLDWETKGDDTSFFSAPVDNAGALRYSFKEVTALSLNGVAGGNGFCVDTFNIQFDNNMQTQRCIGTGSAFAGANIPTTFTPSGQITLSWSKAAWEVYKKRSPAKRYRLALRWRMLKAHIPSISRKCRFPVTGLMLAVLTLFRFSWISQQPIRRRRSRACLKSRQRRSALLLQRHPVQSALLSTWPPRLHQLTLLIPSSGRHRIRLSPAWFLPGRKQRRSRVTQLAVQPSPVRPAPLRQRLKSSLPRLNLPGPFCSHRGSGFIMELLC